MNFSGKTVLIIGASSGIGRVLALRLARAGATIVATARRRERLEALVIEVNAAGGRCTIHTADAQDSRSAAAVVQACFEAHGRIDMLVLNAGGAPAIDMRRMQADEVLAYMRANYDVAVNYLMPVLHRMRLQGSGMVVTTNSLAGFLGVPLQGPYSAAKGALRLLIDTCRIEFGAYGIKFVSVYPGFIATEATSGDGMPAPLAMSEDRAVNHLMRAITRERMDYSFPWQMSWLIKLTYVLPKWLVVRILRRDLPPMPTETQT